MTLNPDTLAAIEALPTWPPYSDSQTMTMDRYVSRDAVLDLLRSEAGEKDATIERLTRALRVNTHKPHDQDGEPVEGFPVCSVCGAIQTLLRSEAGGEPAEVRDIIEDLLEHMPADHLPCKARDRARAYLAALSPSPEATPTPAWAKEDQDVPT